MYQNVKFAHSDLYSNPAANIPDVSEKQVVVSFAGRLNFWPDIVSKRPFFPKATKHQPLADALPQPRFKCFDL